MDVVVAFDESGNTGPNLLDPVQPVFVLASCQLSEEEANEILLPAPTRAPERRFSTLKRSAAGRAAILNVLNNALLPERIRLMAIHKRFMLFGKIIDDVLELPMREDGIDIYAGRSNIEATKALYASEIVEPNAPWQPFLESFQRLVRLPSIETAEEFRTHARVLSDAVQHAGMKALIASFRRPSVELVEHVSMAEFPSGDGLDPAVPALFEQLDAWSRILPSFRVLHDDTIVIRRWKSYMERATNVEQPYTEHGYDTRTIRLPFHAEGIDFAVSQESAAVQVADVISGATVYALKSQLAGSSPDSFATALLKTAAVNILHNSVGPWPDEADPE